ncbi:MAG TPA: hypothetical protein VF796_06155, partial [Humisphaera sp.]
VGLKVLADGSVGAGRAAGGRLARLNVRQKLGETCVGNHRESPRITIFGFILDADAVKLQTASLRGRP